MSVLGGVLRGRRRAGQGVGFAHGLGRMGYHDLGDRACLGEFRQLCEIVYCFSLIVPARMS